MLSEGLRVFAYMVTFEYSSKRLCLHKSKTLLAEGNDLDR
jgi:hypothetical protein